MSVRVPGPTHSHSQSPPPSSSPLPPRGASSRASRLSLRRLVASLAPLAVLAVGAVVAGNSACDATGSLQGGQPLLAEDPCASPDTLTPTWHDLYRCYFGPTAKTSCTAQGFCHGTPQALGGAYSSFICGATSLECWKGMTIGEYICTGAAGDAGGDGETGDAAMADAAPATDAAPRDAAAPLDAAGAPDGAPSLDADAPDATPADDDGGACNPDAGPPAPGCMLAFASIVPTCGASDPTSTYLWKALRGAPVPPNSGGFNNMPYSADGTGYTFTTQDLDLISAWIRGGAKYN
jgi:hypothetical protein